MSHLTKDSLTKLLWPEVKEMYNQSLNIFDPYTAYEQYKIAATKMEMEILPFDRALEKKQGEWSVVEFPWYDTYREFKAIGLIE